jgi:hypothetical protein
MPAAQDPNEPKKPPTAYTLFRQAVTSELKSSHDNLNAKALTVMCKDQWKGFTDTDKAVRSRCHAHEADL